MGSEARVMMESVERDLATSVARRGTWPRTAPRVLRCVFTAIRPDTGRQSVRSCEVHLREHLRDLPLPPLELLRVGQ